MKTLPLSFLFFCMLIFFNSLCPLFAQINPETTYKYYNAIVNPRGSTDISQAIKYYYNKKENDLKQKDTLSTIEDLRLIAIGHFKVGNIYDSEITVVEALTLIDNYPKKDTLVEGKKALYNQLGNIYRASRNYEKAIEAYNFSLSFSRKQSDSITLINNKANIYKDLGQYQKATQQLNLALAKIDHKTNSLQLALILDNLGHAQSKLGNRQALSNLNRSLKIRENQKYLPGIYSSNKSLAIFYFDQKEKSQALHYADRAYQVAISLNSISYLEDILSLFALMSDDPKMVQFKEITDSIAKDRQLAENKNAFIKYNVANEKKKTTDALLQNEKEKNQKLIFLILGIIIFLTSTYLFFTLRIRHKKEKILQVHKTESRISIKVHDEVANNIYHLMTKIQANVPKTEELLDDLEKIYNKTRDISKENSAMEIQENFSEQLNDLLLSYQSNKVNIITRNISNIEWGQVSKIKKTTIYRVLQELMTNMKKYSEASLVVLVFYQNNKKIDIKYRDNGIGCELKNKNGLQNVENRIHAINGTINFDSAPGKGFKSKIIL